MGRGFPLPPNTYLWQLLRNAGATNFNTVQFDGWMERIVGIDIGVLQADQDGDILMCVRTTVPVVASSGFAKGCVFLKGDAAAGTSGTYENVGTSSACDFQLIASAAGTFLTAQVPLSSAQILALNATPVTLVAAPGAGKVIAVNRITVKMVTTATQYANGGALEFRYTDASGAKVTADIAAGVVTAGAGTSYTSVAGVTTSLTNVANAAIVIDNATAPFITGTGTAVVTIQYQILTP